MKLDRLDWLHLATTPVFLTMVAVSFVWPNATIPFHLAIPIIITESAWAFLSGRLIFGLTFGPLIRKWLPDEEETVKYSKAPGEKE